MNSNKIIKQLQSLLEYQPFQLRVEDKELIEENLQKFIYNTLTSRKFRNAPISKKLKRSVRSTIKFSVENNKPIHISTPFGGYKHHATAEYPNAGWSEVFNVIQMIKYASPIVEAYSPGVILEYFSDEIFVERLNSIPQKHLDIYNNHCNDLCNYFNSTTPKNLEITFSKIRDFISPKTLHERFDKAIFKLNTEWDLLDESTQKTRLQKAERNYAGVLPNDLGEKNRILKQSALVHDAFIFGDWEEGVHWAFESFMIPVGFRYTGEWGIGIYSSEGGSAVQFWVGTGVLQVFENSVKPHIYSLKQFEKIKPHIKTIKTGLKYPFHDEICIYPN